ncbi:MAG: hypothetical protein AAFW84_15270 [Cyanobacteria bacterium J06635_15]
MRILAIGLVTGVAVALLVGVLIQNGVANLTPPTPEATPEMVTDPSEAPPETGDDVMPLPPTEQTVVSASGQYILEITASDGWDSTRAIAALYRNSANQDARELLWQRSLPQSYGPKYAVVSNQGQVVMLDEWINVASPYAVMVFDQNDNLLSQTSFDRLQTLLAVPRRQIVDQAMQGWWISAPPKLNTESAAVTVKTAGKQLIIDLTTGELTAL